MVVLAALQYLEIVECLLLKCYEDAGNNLLPLYCLRLQTVRNDIVNILYEDNVSIYLVKVLYQRTVPARTEQQGTVAVAEQCIVWINSHSIC